MRGYEMLIEGAEVSEGVMDVCRHHHERWDGTGYPGQAGGREDFAVGADGCGLRRL